MLDGKGGNASAGWLMPALAAGGDDCLPAGTGDRPEPPAPAADPVEDVLQVAADLDQALSAACPMAGHRRRRRPPGLRRRPGRPAGAAQPHGHAVRLGRAADGEVRTLEGANRTDFNPRIWRRLYLATFMFPGGHAVEIAGETAVIRIPVVFRTDLDPGNFPYPFWHSAAKWQSYQTATDLLFFLRGGQADRCPAIGGAGSDPPAAGDEVGRALDVAVRPGQRAQGHAVLVRLLGGQPQGGRAGPQLPGDGEGAAQGELPHLPQPRQHRQDEPAGAVQLPQPGAVRAGTT